jgi:hypothetical protein
MNNIIDDVIYLTRGDTMYFEAAAYAKDDDGKAVQYELQDGDKLVFTMRKTTSSEILIQKDVTGGYAKINPEDTQSCEFGKYVYDVQLTYGGFMKTVTIDGGSKTVILGGTFRDCVKMASLDLSGMINTTMSGNQMAYFLWDTPALKKIWLPSTCVNFGGSDANNSPVRGTNTACVIYTDAKSKPSGWTDTFNYQATNVQLQVVYGATYDQYLNA